MKLYAYKNIFTGCVDFYDKERDDVNNAKILGVITLEGSQPATEYLNVYSHRAAFFYQDYNFAKTCAKEKGYKYTIKITNFPSGAVKAEVIKL